MTNKECVNGVIQTAAGIPTAMNLASVRDPAPTEASVAVESVQAYCWTIKKVSIALSASTELTAERASMRTSHTGQW